ncbi:MAG: hypothetical protein P8M22_06655 [Phycisphaerales bacterium]|nr:hypothetical protein [Phycisphaerales bacterium]
MSTTENSNDVRPNRVLHLVDGVDAGGLGGASGSLRDLLEDRSHDLVVCVGGQHRTDMMPRLTPARQRFLSFGDGGLSRLLRHIESTDGRVDAVHAWGMRGTALLMQCPPGKIQVVSMDGFQADAPEARAAATVMRAGRVESLLGSYQTQRVISNMLGSGTCLSGRERIASPAANPALLAKRSDELRCQWGARSDSLVIGLVGSPMGHLNLKDQCGLPTRCSLLGRHVVMLASSKGSNRGDLIRWMEKASPQVDLVFDDIIERTREVASSLDAAIAPSSTGFRTRTCDVDPVMCVVAAGRPVVLGVGHPAGEYADREDLIRAGAEHDQHQSTRWLMAHLESSARQDVHERARMRFEGYVNAVEQLYKRAAAATGQSWSDSRSDMAAS